MSYSDTLRLLRDSLVLHGERLDLISGNILKVRPRVTDTGSINIGDGTYDMDVKVFLGSTTEYVLFDVGNSQLDLQCPLTVTGDLTVAGVTTFTDTVVTAEHGAGAIGTSVVPATSRRTVNGTIITEIKIDLTGLACKGDAAKDAIGLAAGGKAAYIGRYVVATYGVVYRVEMICLEAPGEGTATITADIDLGAEDHGNIVYDGPVDDVVINTGGLAAGKVFINNVPALTANDYLYLVEGDTAATTGVYNAGQIIVRLYGHPVLT